MAGSLGFHERSACMGMTLLRLSFSLGNVIIYGWTRTNDRTLSGPALPPELRKITLPQLNPSELLILCLRP
jgi:hypothetical protein